MNSQVLPDDFPEISVLVHDDPAPGYTFIAPGPLFNLFPNSTPYLAIIDNYGTPVYYLKLSMVAYDFKLQPSIGLLSFHEGGFGFASFIMDSSYTIVKQVAMKNHWPDFHDFRVTEDTTYLMIGWDDRLVDMDTVVPGGHPGVTVRGLAIEEQDNEGNIIWEWSSWGHIKITDASEDHVDFYDSTFIDFIHCNAIDQDTDSTILLSSRHLDEITKINKNTGEIIWRLGGKRNEFTYIGDTTGFSAQHHIRRLPNGNYILFDNGFHHDPPFSSALEFQLDEENKVANFYARYRSQPEDIMSWAMGNSEKLPGGNIFIGWGSGVPNVTEMKPDGSKTLEFDYASVSYRAYKFPWETNVISFNEDTLNFDEINSADSSSSLIEITSNYYENFTVTSVLSNTGKFKNVSDLPLVIAPGETNTLRIRFIPGENGTFEDVMTVCWDIETTDMTRRIAKQFYVKGYASDDYGIDEAWEGKFLIVPNPSAGNASLRYQLSDERYMTFEMYDITGRKIKNLLSKRVQPGKHVLQIDTRDLPAGIYLVRMQNEKQYAVKKLVVR